eukprot:jgi/Mesen1/899/ME001156S00138
MCVIFSPCADPVTPGVYWRDNRSWQRYNAQTSTAILDALLKGYPDVELGRFTSPVYPFGAPYCANLRRMQQINIHSGQARGIKVIERPSKSSSPSSKDNASAILKSGAPTGRVYWWNESDWQAYDNEVSAAILQAAAQGLSMADIGSVRGGHYFRVNLMTMEQYDMCTGKISTVKIEVKEGTPSNGKTLGRTLERLLEKKMKNGYHISDARDSKKLMKRGATIDEISGFIKKEW